MKEELIDILACPICHRDLEFHGSKANDRLQEGYLTCIQCSQSFQICDQIPDFRITARLELTEKKVLELLDIEWLKERTTYPQALPVEIKEAYELERKHICSKVKGYSPILDIATGVGSLLRRMADTLSGSQLVGTNIDENMLKRAQQVLREQNLYQRTSLLLCDAKRLPLHSSLVPCVVSYGGLSNIPNAVEALLEAKRVLSPGGVIVFSTAFLNEESRSLECAKRLGVADLVSKKLLRKLLDEAGLKLVSTEDIYSGIWPGYSKDLLPFKGDRFSETLIVATRKEKVKT